MKTVEKRKFENADAKPAAKTQFFDNNGSRGVYRDGWYACTFGPLYPWIPAQQGLDKWNSKNDVWELYNLNEESSYIFYIDANNLYGWAQSQPLPKSNFEMLDEGELREARRALTSDDLRTRLVFRHGSPIQSSTASNDKCAR